MVTVTGIQHQQRLLADPAAVIRPGRTLLFWSAHHLVEQVSGMQRNGDMASVTDGSEDVDIKAPARFNPADNSVGAIGGYIGNAVGEEYHTELAGEEGVFPVFIDPRLLERDLDFTAYWSTGGALKYLIATQSFPVDGAGNEYVQFPTFSSIDLLVEAYAALRALRSNPGDASVRARLAAHQRSFRRRRQVGG